MTKGREGKFRVGRKKIGHALGESDERGSCDDADGAEKKDCCLYQGGGGKRQPTFIEGRKKPEGEGSKLLRLQGLNQT